MLSENTYHNEIIKYYNSSQKDYEIVWGAKKHLSFHYGFWEKGIKNHVDAINNMSNKIAVEANITKSMRLADLGCGIGGPAMFLSKKYNCLVDGISLSQKQITQANTIATQNNIQAKFVAGDYCHTPFLDNYYDVVYAIESCCHAKNKSDFFKEAYRILKPDGKLIIHDFFWTGNEKTEADKSIMHLWCNSWAIDNFAYENDFIIGCQNTGFNNVTKKNVTKNIEPSIKKLYRLFIPSYAADGLLRLIGKRKGKHKNMFSALYQYKAFKRNLWHYNIVVAQKPE